MNESIIAIAAIIVPVVGGIIAWIMHGLDSRIKSLEDSNDQLARGKLDKEDYYRDQGAMRETLRVMSDDIKGLASTMSAWPTEMIKIIMNLDLGKN